MKSDIAETIIFSTAMLLLGLLAIALIVLVASIPFAILGAIILWALEVFVDVGEWGWWSAAAVGFVVSLIIKLFK